jgi:hypothetical protein
MPYRAAKKPRIPLCEHAAEFLRLFPIMCWMVRPSSTRRRGTCRLVTSTDFARTWRYWLATVKAWRGVERAERYALRHDRPVLCGMIYYLRARVDRRMRPVLG